jgi:hypothetical protein
MNSTTITPDVLAKRPTVEKELQKIRHESLIATRAGDFRKVAQLTRAAARLNQELKTSAG